jgi:ABC-2 type transport system permease protein
MELDQPGRPTGGGSGPVPKWLRFFRSELGLVYGRPRNRALLGVLCAVPVFFGVLFRLASSARVGPGGGPAFENQIAGNGVFLALVVLSLLMLVILPLAVAVVSGDSIAGEASLGTLRGLLTVPAGRTRLLAVNYAVIVVFGASASLLVTAVSLIMGLILFPAGPVTLLSGSTVPLAAGVLRVLLAGAYLAAALAALGAIGLAISTLTRHPVAAIAGTLLVVVGSEICDQVPQLARIQPLLPPHYWLAWVGLFRSPADWSGMADGLLAFAAYILICAAIAWARLTTADVAT